MNTSSAVGGPLVPTLEIFWPIENPSSPFSIGQAVMPWRPSAPIGCHCSRGKRSSKLGHSVSGAICSSANRATQSQLASTALPRCNSHSVWRARAQSLVGWSIQPGGPAKVPRVLESPLSSSATARGEVQHFPIIRLRSERRYPFDRSRIQAWIATAGRRGPRQPLRRHSRAARNCSCRSDRGRGRRGTG